MEILRAWRYSNGGTFSILCINCKAIDYHVEKDSLSLCLDCRLRVAQNPYSGLVTPESLLLPEINI